MYTFAYIHLCINIYIYIHTYKHLYIHNHIGGQGNGSKWGYRHSDTLTVKEKDLDYYYNEYIKLSRVHNWVSKGEV
jgi:hypothetical protein